MILVGLYGKIFMVTFVFVSKGLPQMALISPVSKQSHSYGDVEGIEMLSVPLWNPQSTEGVRECPHIASHP